MAWTELLSQYGYIALFGGCLLEGETLLLLAGLAARGGLLSFPVVVLVAFVGGALGDQIGFFIGRRYGDRVMELMPKLEARAARVRGLIDRHAGIWIVGVRFMYGLRLVGPVVIGMSDVPVRRFLAFNLLGAAIWAVAVAGAGYLFGHALDWLLTDIERLEKLLLIGLVVGVVVLLGWRWYRRRGAR